jgi:hypothetical protein
VFTIIVSVLNCDSLGIHYIFLWVVSVPNCSSFDIHFVLMFGLGMLGVGTIDMSTMIKYLCSFVIALFQRFVVKVQAHVYVCLFEWIWWPMDDFLVKAIHKLWHDFAPSTSLVYQLKVFGHLFDKNILNYIKLFINF